MPLSSVKTIFHYIYIFSLNFHILAGVGPGCGCGCGRRKGRGVKWILLCLLRAAFCFHFMVMPPSPYSFPYPLYFSSFFLFFGLTFSNSHFPALKCRLARSFGRISYVSILNRLFMFEFYCIFYALHWPHSALFYFI